MEWFKQNSSVLILGVLFVMYVTFNENKERPMPTYIIDRNKAINVDSLVSAIEFNNRRVIDSVVLVDRKSIDSLKIVIKKDVIKYKYLEKNINHINSVIGELPEF